MFVKQFAKLMSVTPDTVRYYTRVMLLTPSINKDNGYHYYGANEQKRLKFILSARQLGFSVKDIKSIIEESQRGRCPCPLTRQLIAKRLIETQALFEQTLALRDRMQTALAQWDKTDNGASGDEICGLIETFVDPQNKEQIS